ncbi:MAG: hypothetical protein WDW36_003918 [Sanguina aurantia]
MEELLQTLNQLGPQTAPDPSEFALYLQNFREPILNLLKYEGPLAQSRAEVSSLTVQTTKFGEQRLDREPDVRLALLLSDELKLNEVTCVELLVTVYEMRGTFTAEAAAGYHLEERQAATKAVARLALEAATSMYTHIAGAPLQQYQTQILDFVSGLLMEKTPAGEPQLVGRLVEILKLAAKLSQPPPPPSAGLTDTPSAPVARPAGVNVPGVPPLQREPASHFEGEGDVPMGRSQAHPLLITLPSLSIECAGGPSCSQPHEHAIVTHMGRVTKSPAPAGGDQGVGPLGQDP